MVKVLDPKGETVTHGSPYKFTILNSSQNNHIGEYSISTTWRIQFYSNLWGWKEDISCYFSANLQTVRSPKFGDTIEAILNNSAE